MKLGRGGFPYWKIWQRLFSNTDFRIHWAIEGMWFSHGRDFLGVLYAGRDIGEEIEGNTYESDIQKSDNRRYQFADKIKN